MTLQSQNDHVVTAHYDILVGTDGARSHVRKYLEEATNLSCEKDYIPDAYKTLFLNRSNFQEKIDLGTNRLHGSGLEGMRILMVPQLNDKLNGVIIFDAKNNPFETLKNKEDVLGFFAEKFSIFAKLMSEAEAEELLTRTVARVITVRCDRFHEGDSILIIGNAAHAVSPSIGQGCNSALEDVLILD